MWCSRVLVPTYREWTSERLDEWKRVQMKKDRDWLKEKSGAKKTKKPNAENEWENAVKERVRSPTTCFDIFIHVFISVAFSLSWILRALSQASHLKWVCACACVYMKVCVPLNGIYSVHLIATLQAVHSHFVKPQFHSFIPSVSQSLIHSFRILMMSWKYSAVVLQLSCFIVVLFSCIYELHAMRRPLPHSHRFNSTGLF